MHESLCKEIKSWRNGEIWVFLLLNLMKNLRDSWKNVTGQKWVFLPIPIYPGMESSPLKWRSYKLFQEKLRKSFPSFYDQLQGRWKRKDLNHLPASVISSNSSTYSVCQGAIFWYSVSWTSSRYFLLLHVLPGGHCSRFFLLFVVIGLAHDPELILFHYYVCLWRIEVQTVKHTAQSL